MRRNSISSILCDGMWRVALLLAALLMAPCPADAQRIEVEKGDMHCGNVEYDKPVTAIFNLKNRGSRKLVITDVDVSCGCLSADYPEGEIAGGEEFTLSLTYDARQLGHFYKEALVYSNGSKEPLCLSMRGVVMDEVEGFYGQYPYTIGELGADRCDIVFDDVNMGDCPEAQIHIVNQGYETLTPNLMHLPAYLSAEVSPQNLRPGMSGTITVRLNSSKLHDLGITETSLYLANQIGDKVSHDNEITVSAIVLPSFASMSETERLNPPHISLSAENIEVDFEGKGKKTEKIDIVNTGKSTLEISSLHVFTSALNITLGERRLAPMESTTLKITVLKQEALKARTQPQVLMITNDPDKPKVVIGIDIKD